MLTSGIRATTTTAATASDLEFPNHNHATRFASIRRKEAMEKLSPESRAIYDILKAETREAYESRFLEHKKEILDAVRNFIDDTDKQLKEINESIDSVKESVGSDLEAVKDILGGDLDNVKSSLSGEIAQLTAVMDRAIRTRPTGDEGGPPVPPTRFACASTISPTGHGWNQNHWGSACSLSTPPPVGGMNSAPSFMSLPNSVAHPHYPDASVSAPRVELPQFEGPNPKLWQRRCEEYFRRWGMPMELWVSYASSQFTGAAAIWLEAFPTKKPQETWEEFVAAVQGRFMRNQHRVLLRRLFHISQTGTVEDYVRRFTDLIDQIAAFDPHPDPLNHLTRFLDGLKPTVRILVAIQQPEMLDSAYTMALLYE